MTICGVRDRCISVRRTIFLFGLSKRMVVCHKHGEWIPLLSGSKSRYCDPNGKSQVTGWYAMAFFFHPIMWISAILRRFIKHTIVSGIIAPPGKSGMPRLLPRWQIAGVSCWRIWKPERFVPKPSGHNLVSGMSGL